MIYNKTRDIKKICKDIAKFEDKFGSYPRTLKEIEEKFDLPKLSISTYYKLRHRELINKARKE